jgi:hypothetical protein
MPALILEQIEPKGECYVPRPPCFRICAGPVLPSLLLDCCMIHNTILGRLGS